MSFPMNRTIRRLRGRPLCPAKASAQGRRGYNRLIANLREGRDRVQPSQSGALVHILGAADLAVAARGLHLKVSS